MIFPLVLAYIAFTIKGILVLDTDFGWHTRMGELILHSGIPATDPFSYTMPSYPFVDHEWLTNVALFFLYKNIGEIGLAALFACFATLAIYIPLRKAKGPDGALLAILIAGSILPFVGVRTQILSWFLFSVALLAIRSRSKYARFFLILLTLIWTNMHGSFPTVIVIFVLYHAARLFQNKKLNTAELTTATAMMGITFVNPYRDRIWWEVWMQMSDHSLRWSILEWMPTLFFINFPLWIYGVLSVTLVWKYRSKIPLSEHAVYSFLFISMMSSYRHAPLWLLVSVEPTLQALGHFRKEVIDYPFGEARLKVFINLLVVVSAVACIATYEFLVRTYSDASGRALFPDKAIAYIRTHMPEGEIFTPYEWGGYFIWQLPEKKVFIDGRMPSWRWDAPEGESDNAFVDYRNALYGEPHEFETVTKKYNIELLVLPRRQARTESLAARIPNWITKLFPQEKKKQKSVTEDLTKVYEDDVAVVYTTKHADHSGGTDK